MSGQERWSSWAAWWYLALGCVAIAVSYLDLLGSYRDVVYPVLVLSCFGATIVGIRRYRPARRWPFVCFAAAVGLFFVGGATRQAWHTLGDVSAHRSLIPDLVTIPGYVLLGLGLFGLSHARRGGRRDLDSLLDASLVGLGALAGAWAYLIAPALAEQRSPTEVKFVLAAYPAASVFLVAAWLQTLATGGPKRAMSHRLLLAALSFLLLGDVIYVVVDARIASIPNRIIDVPYLLANVAFGVVHLHPSMRELCEPVPHAEGGPMRSRLAVVSFALGLPAVVVLSRPGLSTSDRWVLAIIVVALTSVAIWRVFRALRAHARSEERLVQQATHDSLTGLPNRRYVNEFLQQALVRRENTAALVGVLFLDVDRFKLVNDALGHEVGDQVIIAAARRLERIVPAGAVIARVGGDEFVVVLHGVADVAHAQRCAEEVRVAFSIPFAIHESEVFAGVSIGIAVAGPDDQSTPESLVRDADTAMYQAKLAGRDAIAIFDADARARTSRRLLLDGELRGVIERGELALHYQPVLECDSRRVVGFEALLRWFHPTLGMIPPLDFVPVAEETGLILPIGAWVLQQACEQLAEWRSSIPDAQDAYMSVNVSARQLRDPNFVDQVARTVEIAGLPTNAVRLELTESMFVDQQVAGDVLRELRAIGVALSIDDFGTGYSSLAYLRRFTVDEVKIDKSFIDELADADSPSESVVAAIVALVHALGITATAEGVELPEQADRLRALGVDAAQGYLFSRPVDACEIPRTIGRLNQLTTREERREPLSENA